MRTTLLLTAALGLVGTATTMAQVYSVNAVGYVNVVLKSGFQMVANPLNNQTDNKLSTLMPQPPAGTQVYKFINGAYLDPNGYEPDFGGWSDPNMELKPGEGAFVFLQAGTPNTTVTFVGEVPQGNLSNPLPAGFAMVSSQVPQRGLLQTDLKYPAVAGDMVYTFVNGAYEIYSYEPDFGGWTKDGNPLEPTMEVGQAFWSSKAAAVAWTRTFSVNTP